MENFSDLVQEEDFQNWCWMEWDMKNVRFQWKNWTYPGNGDSAKATKWHTPYQMKMEIIDLG